MTEFKTVDLSRFTTWGIGGPSRAAFPGNDDELASVVEYLENKSIPWTVLGRGSNTLAPSEGWDGVVIVLSGEYQRFRFRGTSLAAGGGAPLPSMAGAACSLGLDGLVFAVGIPGSAGGAVFMNAGAYGSSLSDVVREVTFLSRAGELHTLAMEQCGFAYRKSRFQEGAPVVITQVVMDLSRCDGGPGILRERASQVLSLRRAKFPLGVPNAGSVFKRPVDGPPPGRLIEDCGLKGLAVGGAMVSHVHANFIENRGGATSGDVIRLMELVHHRVLQRTGYDLLREVELLGER
ncbi:MAG TPA: UDP-N-acetylmuramate dehydrogenase [Candidatus Sabulitectum sp.]|nr:UDP-N-acetylmuramate dehydrogenase [Candidatus Sabulitectum sp.]